MKHSQTIGIILCGLLILTTTQPLVIIESQHWIITGWKTEGSNFGQPGKFLTFFSVLAILFFSLPYLWAKRFNMVFATFLLSWSIRNYLILSTCQMGECPQKQVALWACIFLSAVILVMTFLPKLEIKSSN